MKTLKKTTTNYIGILYLLKVVFTLSQSNKVLLSCYEGASIKYFLVGYACGRSCYLAYLVGALFKVGPGLLQYLLLLSFQLGYWNESSN